MTKREKRRVFNLKAKAERKACRMPGHVYVGKVLNLEINGQKVMGAGRMFIKDGIVHFE